MENIIQQGSTPIHTFSTPYKKEEIQKIIITYFQNGRIICEKKDDDISVSDFSLLTKLTQEDTLLFDEKGDVKMQIKVKLKSGDVIPSNNMYAKVNEVLNKEVL